MKKSHFIHVGWAIVALVSFILGSQFVSESRSGTGTQNSDTGESTSSAPGLSNRNVENEKGSSARSDRNRTDEETLATSTTILSEAQISQLGLDLRNARNPIERREIFGQLLASLTVENAKTIREQIAHLDSDSSEFRDFHYAWGAIAGQEAVLNGAETKERDMATTLAGWAGADPDAALAYYNGLSDEEKNNNELKWGAAHGLADADPNLAVQFALDRHASGDRDAGKLIDLAAREVLRSGDMADAAQWATTIPDGPMQAAAISRVAREYADENPVAATQWATTLPAGDAKNKALWNSFREWAGDDPEAAAGKLNSMSSSPERDSAAYGYTNRIAWEDPAAALDWAGTITNQDTRQRAVMESARVYYRKDPEAAKQWLSTSGLDEKQQAEVTRRGDRG
ncbi:MAG: hypothetical protein QNL33_04795 [Akkermansiaceae bacterium]|jgi:hypothetical protein